MDIVTVDFETYYDKEYSLSKMTTESYIRDPRFEIIGVSVKVNDGKAIWFSGSLEETKSWLETFHLRTCAVLCHNTAFDGAILSWICGIRPALWLDTLSLARPFHGITCGVSLSALSREYGLGEKGTAVKIFLGKKRAEFSESELAEYAEYCIQDNNLTYALFKKLVRKVPQSEIELIDMTIRMFTEPKFELDSALLGEHLAEVQEKRNRFFAALNKEMLMSNEKFAAALRVCGIEPPMKVSKTTGKPTYAFAKTDKEFTELQEHSDERVQLLVAARLGVKSTIEETRTKSFLGIASRGPLPIMLNYWGAHPGRFSGGDKVNLQNLPRSGKIRKAIRAPKGHKVIVCDSSQIEARLVGYLAKQDDLVQAFRDGRDVYCEFGTEVYGRPITKADKVERFVSKTGVLGLGYQCGAERFRDMLASGVAGMVVSIDELEAKRVVNVYRKKNHKVVSLWTTMGSTLKSMASGNSGYITDHVALRYEPNKIILPNGMPISYPELKPSSDGFTYISRKKPVKIYGGKTTENITQALARLVITEQMLRISKRYPIALQVHDEIVCIVRDEDVDEAVAFIKEEMSKPPSFAPHLPVSCEIGVGDTYGDAK